MRIIDAENFDVFYYTIPDGVDADSFGMGIEYMLEEIDKTPTYIPDNCKHCSNHSSNGGSGICHCILGSPIIW